ncbi:hypothetical protein IWW45_000643 [Coemansia sp. RSA 485]|nr:hypothetical protein IWW45_000643 [Coemansia sp. RSA 485]
MTRPLLARTYATTPPPIHKFEKYQPEIVESDWYSWWQKEGLFKPTEKSDSKKKQPTFSMLLPPPNVTGVLHIGHALTLTIQDSIARWNRMHGRIVNWVPGTDHAGISMQSVVEKKLLRESGKSRHDLGRDRFIDKVWEWKQEHGECIKMQTQKMGASVDWDQEYFTMDDHHSKTSVISDIEMYLVVNQKTTRPETMLGDVALAINSNDSRYKGLEGRKVLHPLIDKDIPIVCDDILVDPEFGSGVVKITPAHDENDYACAQRLGLPVVPVFSPDGTVISQPLFPGFSGLSRWDARRKVIRDLKESKAYVGKRDAEASVINRCSRSGDIIEPMLKPQWYVRCGDLAKRADEMVQTGHISMVPKRQRAIWHSWLTGIQDWCVSRQLWWGHRIPVYRISWADGNRRDIWVAAESEQHAREKALLGSKSPGSVAGEISAVVQDEDVLDTWFSSGLLPLTVFGQHKSQALSSVLETGQDILFFWVARMAMLCTYFAGVPPFSTVLLHPMVRDLQGRKMSKSLGNIIDPMDVIQGAGLSKLQETLERGYLSKQELSKSTKELKRLYPTGFQQFGADALRLTLILYTQQTQQINMSLDNVKASYHFCNKLWNTFRFAHMHAQKHGVKIRDSWSDGISERLSVFDRALLSKLSSMLGSYHQAMETYRLAVAAEAARDFVQRDLCDAYIEICKLALFGSKSATRQDPAICIEILLHTLDIVLRALHPFMPFLSEELWQQQRQLKQRQIGEHNDVVENSKSLSIMEMVWEQTDTCSIIKHNAQAEAENEMVLGIVSGIRSLRQRHGKQLVTMGEADKPVFLVFVSESSLTAGRASGDVDDFERRHGECIRALSKEPQIGIHSEQNARPVESSEHMVSVVVSPQVQVVSKLDSRETGSSDSRVDEVAVGKLKAELESVYRVVNSDGYQKKAPPGVKQADR